METSDPQKQIIDALLRDFQVRRKRNPAFSIRAYARFLGIQASGLSDLLNGKRRVTRRMGEKLLAKISVAPGESAELFEGLRKKQPRLPKVQAPAAPSYVLLERAKFELLSDWHHLATLSLAELDDFKPTPAWIAKRLGISTRHAQEALNRLRQLGLVFEDPKTGKTRRTHQNLATLSDVPDLAIQRSHQQHLELASTAIDRFTVHERDFSFVNIATDSERIAVAKERIKAFRRELTAELEKSTNKDTVFRMGVQLFPLTKKTVSKSKESRK